MIYAPKSAMWQKKRRQPAEAAFIFLAAHLTSEFCGLRGTRKAIVQTADLYPPPIRGVLSISIWQSCASPLWHVHHITFSSQLQDTTTLSSTGTWCRYLLQTITKQNNMSSLQSIPSSTIKPNKFTALSLSHVPRTIRALSDFSSHQLETDGDCGTFNCWLGLMHILQ